MSFPTSPSNGQLATVNGITYVYNSAYTAWYRTGNVVTLSNLTITSTTLPNALAVAGNVGIGGSLQVAGNLALSGNLVVAGNITTINYETVTYTETANVITANTLTVTGNVVLGSNANPTMGSNITLQGQLQPYTLTSLNGASPTYNSVILTVPMNTWNIVETDGTSSRYAFNREAGGNLNIGQATGFHANLNLWSGTTPNSSVTFNTGTTDQYRSSFDYYGNLNVAGNTIVNGGILTLANVVGSNTAAAITTTGTTGNTALVLQPQGNIDLSAGTVNLSNGTGVTALTVTTGGGLYTSIPTPTITAPTTSGGVQATASCNMLLANTPTVTNGGTGYSVNDVLTISGGTFSVAGQLTVTAVSGGVITAATISAYGTYTALPSNPVSVTGGTGTSATFTVTWGVRSLNITTAGSGYVEQPTVTISGGGGGSGAAAYATVGSGTVVKSIGSTMSFVTDANEILRINGASRNNVNYINVFGQAAGSAPSFSVAGADTNVTFDLFSKGTGSIRARTGTGGATQFQISDTVNAVNYVNVTGAATSGSPTISAQGTDANVDISLTTKGIGNVNVSGPVIINSTLDYNYTASPGTMSFYSRGGGYFNKSVASGTQFITTTENNPAYLLNTPSPGWGAIGNWYPNGVAGGTWALGYSGGTTWSSQVLTWSANNVATITAPSVLTTGGQYWNGGTGNIQANGSISVAGSTTSQTVYLAGGNNLFTQSNLALWQYGGNTTIAATGVTAPDGTPTAATFTTVGAGGSEYIYWNVGSVANTTYTISVYAKPVSFTTFYIQAFQQGGQVGFSLSGAGSVSSAPTGTFSNPNIVAVGNGWYRCSINFTATATATGNFGFSTNQNNLTQTDYYLWGAQFEPGNIASPYTATSGSAITNYNNLYIPQGNLAVSGSINLASTGNNNSLILQSQSNVDISANSVVLSNGGTVTAFTKTATGTSYTSVPTVTISAPTTNTGTTATANVTMLLASATVANVGAGYSVGDVLTITGATGPNPNAQVTVTGNTATTYGAGGISSISVSSNGVLYSLPTNPITVTGGTGTGATINGNFGVNYLTVVAAGSGYVEQPTISFSGGGGSGATAYATVGSGTTVKSIGNTIQFATPAGVQAQISDSSGSTPTSIVNLNGSTFGIAYVTAAGSAGSSILLLSSKGTSAVDVYTNTTGSRAASFSHTASAVNYVQVTGSTTGTFPVISAQGSDATLGLNLYSKGAARINFFNNNGTNRQVSIGGAGQPAVNYIGLDGSTSGSAPSISVAGSDTNIDLSLVSKGIGNVTTTSPVVVTNANVSTSTGTGALIVTGGAGIGGNLYVGGNTTVSGGQLTVQNTLGNIQFTVANTANAVNYFQMQGSTTGSFLYQLAQGSDTNVSLGITTKGSGLISLGTNTGVDQLRVTHTASAVNYLQITGGASGTAPSITSTGSDSSVGMTFATKNTLPFVFGGAGGTHFIVSPTYNTVGAAPVINQLQVQGGFAGNVATLSAQGNDANVSILLQPKGITSNLNIVANGAVNISSGGTVTALTRTSGGTGYTSSPTITITAPTTTGGVQATANCVIYTSGISSINSGGTGYTLNDVLTVSGGTFTSATQITVTAVSSGVITAASVTGLGSYTVAPSNPVSVTGGTGSGATFTLSAYGVSTNSLTITNAGSGYVEQPTVTISGGGGSGATAYATVGSGTTVKSIGNQLNLATSSGTGFAVADAGTNTSYYWQAIGGAFTGILRSSGSTQDGLIQTSGTGGISLQTNNGAQTQFKATHTASAVNYVQITGAATGYVPAISSQGSDTNINLQLTPKGTGIITSSAALQINSYGSSQIALNASGNYYGVIGTPTGTGQVWGLGWGNSGYFGGQALTWGNTGNVKLPAGIPSTSTSTGALTIPYAGGIGVTGNVNIGGTTSIAANLNVNGSFLMNGTANYATIPYSTTNFDWFTASVDYTLECWIYPLSYTGWSNPSGIPTSLGSMLPNGGNNNWSFGINTTGVVTFYYYNGSTTYINGTGVAPLNSWSHVAMTKTNSGVTLFINGVLQTNSANTAIVGSPQTGTPISIGAYAGYYPNGFITGIRIVKGTAVYYGNYSIPTSPLTATQSSSANVLAISSGTTLLLTAASPANLLVDSSSINNTVTNNGLNYSGNSPFYTGIVPSTSTTTGALTVAGGAGIAGNLYVGGNIVSTGTSYLIGNVGINTPPSTYILDILDTSNNGTGMRVIGGNTGGALATFTRYGTADSVVIGASNSDAAITFQHGTNNYMSIGTDGSYFRLANYGFIGSGGDLLLVSQANGNVVITSTTTSTNTSTGALTVAGGAGIAGNLYVGGNLVVTGNITTVNYETVLYTETANVLTANTLTVSGNVVLGSNASPLAAGGANTISLQGVLQPYTVVGASETDTNTVLTMPSGAWRISSLISGNDNRQVLGKDSSNNLYFGEGYTNAWGNTIIYAANQLTSGINLVTGPTGSTLAGRFDYYGNLTVAGNTLVNGGILTLANTVGSNTAAVINTSGITGNTALVLQPQGNIDLSTNTVNLSNGTGVTALTRTSPGNGTYTSIPSVVISAPTTAGGVQATATVSMGAAAATIGSGGTGYAVNDVLTLVGGTLATGFATGATFTVTSVSGGVVTAVSATNFNQYITLPTNPVSTTGGTGSGCTLNVLYALGSVWNITNAGSGYIEQPTVAFSGGGGSGAAAYATVGGTTTVKSTGSTSYFSVDNGIGFSVTTSLQPSSYYWQALGHNSVAILRSSGSTQSSQIHTAGTGGVYLGTLGGISQFAVTHTASAVNFAQATGAATGGSPTISAQGSDSYIALSLQSKSAPLILSTRPTGTSFAVIDAGGTSTNYLTVTGPRVSGTAPVLGASGSDANVAIVIQPKNYANIDLNSNSVVLTNGIGSITAITQTATGNLYLSAPTVNISAPQTQLTYGQNNAIQATANANIGVVAVGNITSQGTNYTPGTILTMVGNASAFSNATFVVTTVGNGVGGTGNVTSISLLTAGSYTIANTNPVTFTSSSGSGLQANLYYGVNTPVITNAGSGYVEQPTITFSGGGGSGAGAYATVGSPNTITATGANLSIVLPQGEVVKFVTSPVITGVVNGNINGNIGQYANTALTATALTGNAIAAGGMGVVGNIYGTSRIGFTNVANSSSVAYTVYNSVYNSVDLIFGA